MPGSWWLEASNTDRREKMAMLGDGHQPGNTLLVGIIVCREYLVIVFVSCWSTYFFSAGFSSVAF